MTTPPTSVSAVVLALLQEVHRRQQQYDEYGQVTRDWSLIRRVRFDGESIGLWIALGVALGYTAGPVIFPDVVDFYRRWVASGMPDEVLP
ncbi:hypothetical protein [Streptomyces europaeiscabiei]|uniref:hypothetical protein n=1 Tax=Streptomyces europaeiscabiei TaxID=146819 RepID=UPI0029AB0E17|nr:hypothetical protein [Streptomyces europaeiscabiei]MDX3672713.1 hypothetical protein [Streptomyces europaeiscabiei]